MNESTIWAIILAGMLLTYLTRLSFIALVPHERLPQAMQRSLTYVAPAVLAALVLPELVLTSGDFHLSAFNSRLVAGALAAVVGWRSRNTWLTIASGMIALWLLSAL